MWGCRKGQFSYPDILGSTVHDIDFQNLACTGAKVQNIVSGGPDSQIDAWWERSGDSVQKSTLTLNGNRTNPGDADVATISIGGNDIGFYNILTACVLRVGGWWSGDCDTEVAKAYETLGKPDFSTQIASALKEIIAKNGNDAFKVYMAGYVTFFNESTLLCDRTSFRIYNPHFDNSSQETGQPFLTKALRTQLNNIVTALNTELKRVSESVNAHFADAQRVVFVDPNPAFAGHRWCEDGVYEPDNERPDTWLFLSSSPDNHLPETPPGKFPKTCSEDQSTQTDVRNFSLPDPTTCKDSLRHCNRVTCNDWYGKPASQQRI